MAVERIEFGLLALALSVLLAGSCAERQDSAVDSQAPESDRAGTMAARLERDLGQAPSWVSIYDPERAWNGYTLDFFERTLPILIDMNGEIVHSWPDARVRARLRLLPDGHLLAIGLGRSIVEYDWQGNLVWEYRVEEGYPHHDVVRLTNGHTLMIAAMEGEPTDDLLEVDRTGRVVWRWRSVEFLASHFGAESEGGRDITHLNSLQVLPPNPWFESGDERFRPGNVLISARNLDAVFLIDRQTNQVVWKYQAGLDRQHEAMMIAPGSPGHGHVLIFNNGLKDKYSYRQSSVIEVEPRGESVVWEYRADDFFSPIVGVQQPLANGNVLIGSSLGLRTFEVTRDGEIVWQWTPPFKTKRPSRYPYDFCPQMRTLGDRLETPVEPAQGYRHIDRLIYRFARVQERHEVELEGRSRQLLVAKSACRKLLLPTGARLRLTFAVDRVGLLESGYEEYEARFGATLKVVAGAREIRALSAVMESGGETWVSQVWPLDDYASQWVELCLEAPSILSAGGQIANTHAHWGDPRITGTWDRAIAQRRRLPAKIELSEDEIEVRQEHLKTLGYID